MQSSGYNKLQYTPTVTWSYNLQGGATSGDLDSLVADANAAQSSAITLNSTLTQKIK